MNTIILLILYLIGAPIIGGLLSGLDRILTARMQDRLGPPLLQPFYDVSKLFSKENLVVNELQNFFIYCFLLFIVFTGGLFFTGNDILLVIFALTLASVFLILGAYTTNSPYSTIGAERELLLIMAYEPMLLITAVGMYLVTGSFNVFTIASFHQPLIQFLPGVFLGFLYILPIKFRKSPFDLSMSHHAHQELVRGITTEFTGATLAIIEIAHWYENAFLLGFVYLFFASNWIIAILATLAVYLLQIFIDNNSARLRWQLTVKSSWMVAVVFGALNIILLYILYRI